MALRRANDVLSGGTLLSFYNSRFERGCPLTTNQFTQAQLHPVHTTKGVCGFIPHPYLHSTDYYTADDP